MLSGFPPNSHEFGYGPFSGYGFRAFFLDRLVQGPGYRLHSFLVENPPEHTIIRAESEILK